MRFSHLSSLALLSSVLAQRPSDVSICDYYTTALLTDDTAANQETLLILVVNTAVIGNYTTPNVGIALPGILALGQTYNGVEVNLLQYFDGELVSTNNNGVPSVVNFLDGGGAAALKQNLPAFTTSSNQYGLLTHLYEFFSILLGCSKYGTSPNLAYQGDPSMGRVHKFMDLDTNEVGYFIEQVGLAAASFGVASSDVAIVGNALNSYFGYRCLPPVTIVPGDGPQLQSICEDPDNCPIAPNNPECYAYGSITPPATAGATSSASSSTYSKSKSSSTKSASSSKSSSEYSKSKSSSTKSASSSKSSSEYSKSKSSSTHSSTPSASSSEYSKSKTSSSAKATSSSSYE